MILVVLAVESVIQLASVNGALRSLPAPVARRGTALLGSLTYAAVHMSEAWMALASLENVVISVVFLAFTYVAPGMGKAALTLWTGNAWVHVWAYHAIAPHVLIDTPLIVRIFGIR